MVEYRTPWWQGVYLMGSKHLVIYIVAPRWMHIPPVAAFRDLTKMEKERQV